MKSGSEHTNKNLAHHFDDPVQQYQAASLGMWLFLVTEIMFFSALFTGYAVYRFRFPDGFAHASHHLNILLGGINTIVLISSSLTMALAVHAAQEGRKNNQVKYLISTILLGLVFMGIKAMEYAHKFQEHHVPGPHFHFEGNHPGAELFFSFYFAMTGMHAFHMIVGVVILGIITWQASRGRYTEEYHTPVEMMGLYWHFVDIVWIFLFPLLYLIGRHV